MWSIILQRSLCDSQIFAQSQKLICKAITAKVVEKSRLTHFKEERWSQLRLLWEFFTFHTNYNLFIVPVINYFSLSLCFLCAVQLCGSHPGSTRNDSQTAGAGNGLQDHGARQGIDEGQEEGELLVFCLCKSRIQIKRILYLL